MSADARPDDRSNDEIRPGLVFPARDIVVPRDRQRHKLTCCGIDPALWGDEADPSYIAFLTIMAVREAGFTINGSVHVSQTYEPREPIHVDEPLRLEGRVVERWEVAKGVMFLARFEVCRPDGSVPLVCTRESLRLVPGGLTPTGQASTPPEPAVGTVLSRHRFEPSKVAAFSDEADNLIHSDPDTARRFGFRAPIAAGLMASHLFMAAIRREHPAPEPLSLRVDFRRPMFWDDELAMRVTRRDDGTLHDLALTNGSGKIANSAIFRY